MKTGRLLKFRRPAGEVHAYLYREGTQFRAALYLLSAERSRGQPVHTLAGASETKVEEEVRAWVDKNFPRGR